MNFPNDNELFTKKMYRQFLNCAFFLHTVDNCYRTVESKLVGTEQIWLILILSHCSIITFTNELLN